MTSQRGYLDVVRDAAALLGAQVRAGRLERGWTMQELAERAQISPVTLAKVERGDPGVSLGIAFHAAALVGVPLFDTDERRVATDAALAQRAVLRRRVRRPEEPEADLDF